MASKIKSLERFTYNELPREDRPLHVALEGATHYQKTISRLMAVEQAEVLARAAKKPVKAKAPVNRLQPATLDFSPEHKVVWFPDERTDEDGEVRLEFRPIGYRIVLDHSGSWWFFHLRAKTWTKHMPPRRLTYRSLTPTGEVEQGETIRFGNTAELVQRLKRCPRVATLLVIERARAENELAERVGG